MDTDRASAQFAEHLYSGTCICNHDSEAHVCHFKEPMVATVLEDLRKQCAKRDHHAGMVLNRPPNGIHVPPNLMCGTTGAQAGSTDFPTTVGHHESGVSCATERGEPFTRLQCWIYISDAKPSSDRCVYNSGRRLCGSFALTVNDKPPGERTFCWWFRNDTWDRFVDYSLFGASK
jgi:hypothetical protein